MKFKKNDEVKITIGKDRGKTGKITEVFPKENKILIAGLNVYKRHVKPQGQNKPGGIIDISKSLAMGNIALVCPKCKNAIKTKKRNCEHRGCGQTLTYD